MSWVNPLDSFGVNGFCKAVSKTKFPRVAIHVVSILCDLTRLGSFGVNVVLVSYKTS